MNENDFYDRFQLLLENTKDRNELDSKHDALIQWFGEYFLGIDPDEVKERIVKDSHAEGIDSILIDQKNYRVYFIQAKNVEKYENGNLEGNRFTITI